MTGRQRTVEVGARFGRLQVTQRRLPSEPHLTCICDCGKTVAPRARDVFSGRIQACGCLRLERLRAAKVTHGHAPAPHGRSDPTPTYVSWSAMWTRCTSPRATGWESYGGRGITVCERWRDFTAFLADMGERPDGKTLDRTDVNGNYEPGNCRWATWSEQASNRRPREVATHCRSGEHEFTPENTIIDLTTGRRRCRACRERADMRRDARRRMA